MKRTQCFFTYRVYKGGTANYKPRPFPGMGFFCFFRYLKTGFGGINAEFDGISSKTWRKKSESWWNVAKVSRKSAATWRIPVDNI